MAAYIIAFLFITTQVFAMNVSGFITHIDSPIGFDVGKLHIGMNPQTKCEQMEIYFQNKYAPLLCNSLHLPIGSYVRLSGKISDNGTFLATRVVLGMQMEKRYLEAEHFSGQRKQTLRHVTLMVEAPVIHQRSNGLQGTLSVDGYPMMITPETTLHATTTFNKLNAFPRLSEKAPFPANLLQPNVWLAYRSKIAPNGTIMAEQLNFLHNHVSHSEKKFLSNFTAEIKSPDYDKRIRGSIQYVDGDAIRIVPDKKVQKFISQLGMELVPKYQKKLQKTDATKINFRFYVIYPFIHTGKLDIFQINGCIIGHPRCKYSSIFSPRFALRAFSLML